MSPDQDQLDPNVVATRLPLAIDIDHEMPAVSRGWNPIAQSDDLLITTTTATNSTSAASNNTSVNSTPKNQHPSSSTPSPTATSTLNGNGSSSSASTSPSSTPTTTATIMPLSKSNNGSAYLNGNHNGAIAHNKVNGNATMHGTQSIANGNGTAYSLLPPSESPLHNGSGGGLSHTAGLDVVDASASAAAKTANNNDLFATSSPPRIEKNGWKELPQDDADSTALNAGPNGTTPTATSNGGIKHNDTQHGLGNGNGGGCIPMTSLSEKMPHNNTAEDDPLTGVVCKDIDPDELSTCGIGACQPKWARVFASTKSFMFVFLVAWVLQGMYFTYIVSVITTIEKLFQIKSKTSGMLLSTTEIGQICTALLLTYFAGQGHRPRWIACSMVLFAVCAFGCSIPHFMYGIELQHANNLLYSGRAGGVAVAAAVGEASTGLFSDALRVGQSAVEPRSAAIDELAAKVLPMLANYSQQVEYNLCRVGGNGTSPFDGACPNSTEDGQAQHSMITYTVLPMLVFCMLGVGVGQTAVATLGIPFIDDNVASRESAIYIAITIGVRILGPTSGFMLGSICTRLHVDLLDPGYGPDDPQWIGAWYLGLIIIPTLMFFAALAMFTFPKHLRGHRIPPPSKLRAIESGRQLVEKQQPNSQQQQQQQQQLEHVTVVAVAAAATAAAADNKPRLRDFPKTIRRQLNNDILMFRTASSVLHLLPVAGLYTFLPKYLESQFQMAAHESSMITGMYGILVMGVGIVISGVVILKCSPTARSVAAYIAFTAIVYSAGMAALMFLGCSMDDFIGLKSLSAATATSPSPALSNLSFDGGDLRAYSDSAFEPPCNVTCDCDFNTFAPICGSDGKTYFSSCHAGCSVAFQTPGSAGKMQYRDCQCIQKTQAQTGVLPFEAINGHCDSKCQSYIAFISLFSFLVFVHSTSEVGSMLLIMRCTDPKDKAMAMGIIQFAIGLFGNVPCPIIYGTVIDSTCLVWDTICGKQGACKQYDKDAFRHFFFGTTAGIMFLAFIMDVVVWHKAHRIDIDPENNASTASGSAADCDADAEKQQPAGSDRSGGKDSLVLVPVTTLIATDSSV